MHASLPPPPSKKNPIPPSRKSADGQKIDDSTSGINPQESPTGSVRKRKRRSDDEEQFEYKKFWESIDNLNETAERVAKAAIEMEERKLIEKKRMQIRQLIDANEDRLYKMQDAMEEYNPDSLTYQSKLKRVEAVRARIETLSKEYNDSS
jgi:hypothetical protein